MGGAVDDCRQPMVSLPPKHLPVTQAELASEIQGAPSG
jgi:hypothetical protein